MGLPEPPRSSPRILLVEDNELNRDMLSRRLQRRGFDVRCAENGEAALEMVRDVDPAVVLMDMSLPGIDGLATTRKLKAIDAFADTPVIALTAHSLEENRQSALAAGCADFDTKPVDLQRLLEKIHAVLPAP